MSTWLLLAALAHPGLAAEPSALDRAWHLAESSRIEEAMDAAAGLLREDPGDIGAHRLYAWLWIKALRDAPGAEALYRGWLEDDPDNDVARVVLANTLRWQNRQPGPWCTEAESLLVQPPADLEDVYWAQRALYEIRRVCPGDQGAPRLAIMKLGEQLPEARAYGLRLQLEDQRFDPALAAPLRDFYTEWPWRLTYVGNLWKMSGEGLEQARADALAAAATALASEDPVLVVSAWRLYRYADDPEKLLEAEERMEALDPGYVANQFRFDERVQWVARPGPEPDPTMALITAGTRGMRPRKALAVAQGFADQLPATGPARAAYHAYLAALCDEAGQPIEALAQARQAWQADPTDPYLANDFAYRAAVSGLELTTALEAIQGAVARLPGYDPRGDHPARGYDDWLANSRAHAAAITDTHGWVLHRLGRHDEAAGVLRQALLLAEEPQAAHHLHLGLCYDALGDVEGALRQLGRGLALANGAEPDLERQAYKRLQALYEQHRWAPGGLEAWIALQAPPVHDTATEPTPAEPGDARLGQALPDLAFELDGAPHHLSDFPGVRVVDLWATWCGPCVDAIPSMDALARRYGDRVTFLALSVDADPADVAAFFGDEPARHLRVGWAGRGALREARVTGVPSMFVLDEHGVVRAYHSGWGTGSGGAKASRERVVESIEEALAAQEERAKGE